MRVLFLDFDGVLNTTRTWKPRPDDWRGEWEGNREIPLNMLSIRVEPEKVAILNDVLEKTNADVVLSTSWRNWPDRSYVIDKLREAGFSGEIAGSTPGYLGHGKCRGDEILAWIEGEEELVESFAVLDDNEDMLGVMDHLVLVDPEIGLTDEHVPRLLELLTCSTAVDKL